MNKQEIIEAINSTIVPNGQKGITAEALANILLEIVNASGGGEGGCVTVYAGEGDGIGENLSFTQNEEEKALNAKAFQQIKGGSRAVACDMSRYYSAVIQLEVEYIQLVPNLMYYPQESAAVMGESTELIALIIENSPFILYPDGTLSMPPATE